MRNVGGRPALYRISTGLAHGLATGHIGSDLLPAHVGKDHARHAQCVLTSPRCAHSHGGQHAVGAADQLRQHAGGVPGIFGLAVDGAPQCHRGIRTEHGCSRQAAALEASQRGIELELRDALYIGRGGLAGQHGFQAFRILVRIGQQQLMAHAQLLQQLAPAWTLRSEVNEIRHASGRSHSRW